MNEVYVPVSVVIPCYNYGKYLMAAIDSIEQSTAIVPSKQIIIVNDGSTDPHTIEVLADLRADGYHIINQPNKKLSAARNTGFAAASTEFILPFDADDLLPATAIEKMWWAMRTREGIGFISSWVHNFGDQDWIWRPPAPNPYRILFENTAAATALVRQSVWNDTGGYDENLYGYEDWDFFLKIFELGLGCYQIPEPLLHYRRHGQTLLYRSNLERQRWISLIRAHHPRLFTEEAIREVKHRYGRDQEILIRNTARRLLGGSFLYSWARCAANKLRKRRADGQEQLKELKRCRNERRFATEPVVYRTRAAADQREKVLILLPAIEEQRVFRKLLLTIQGMKEKYYCLGISFRQLPDRYLSEIETNLDELFILPNYLETRYYPQFIGSQCRNKDVDLIISIDNIESCLIMPELTEAMKGIARILVLTERFHSNCLRQEIDPRLALHLADLLIAPERVTAQVGYQESSAKTTPLTGVLKEIWCD